MSSASTSNSFPSQTPDGPSQPDTSSFFPLPSGSTSTANGDSSRAPAPPSTFPNGSASSPAPTLSATSNGSQGHSAGGNIGANYGQGYNAYPYYAPSPQNQQQQQHYPQHQPRQYSPYPAVNGSARYNEPYPQYPHHQSFYQIPPMGVGAPGPGPGTMQNYSGAGPNVTPYGDFSPGPGYMRQPYPGSYQLDPNPPSQPPSSFNDGTGADTTGGMNEAPPYTSHPPPPSIPPPAPSIPGQAGSGQPNQGQGLGGDYGAGGYYWPPGHPYAYGGGVGYPGPAGVPYGYPYDPQFQQPQHAPHFQQPYNYQPQQHHLHHGQHLAHTSSGSNWNASNGSIPQQRDSATPSAASNSGSASGSKLNPAAAGFTFAPAKKDTSSTNGSTPVFASLAQPSSQVSQTTPSSSIPNGTAPASTAAASSGSSRQTQDPKKWSLPVVVDGEKLKGIKDAGIANGEPVSGTQPLEASSPVLGLSRVDEPISNTSTITSTDSISSTTPMTQSVISQPASTSATTPTHVRTPRPNDNEVEGDGEASILFSPQSAASGSHEGVLKFLGSPVSGYTSPSSLSSAVFSVLPPKKKKAQTVDAEPYVLAASRPETNVSTGVTYDAALASAIPKKYKVIKDEAAPEPRRRKSIERRRPSKGPAVVVIGTRQEVMPKPKGDVLSFGELADLTPRIADVPIPSETPTTSTARSDAIASSKKSSSVVNSQAAASSASPAAQPKAWSSVPTGSQPSSQPTSTEPVAEMKAKADSTPVKEQRDESTSSGATDTPSKPAPATPAAPKVKPSSWAALLKPATAATDSSAQAQAGSSSKANDVNGHAENEDDGVRTPTARSAENEAGPSRIPASSSQPPSTPLSPSASKANGPSVPKPSFNYAAAAALNAGLTPAEELAKLLADGVAYQPAPVSGKGKGREIGMVPRGLINTGNMCFANTILQVLVYCPPFTELFEELGKRLKADLARKTPLLEAMIIFLREFVASPQSSGAAAIAQLPTPPTSGTSTPRADARSKEARKEAFVPENVYDAMKENKRFDSMRRGHQEDAEEYLGFFLNTLHEELLYLLSRTSPPRSQPLPNGSASASPDDEVSIQRPVSPDAETDGDGWLEVGKKQKTNVVRATETRESAITRLFGGTIRSILTTPGMKNSVTLEPYQPLQLDIQSPDILSITDALRHLSQPEIVPGVWSASRKANVDATKQMTVETFPRVLILHLKRFVFEMGEMSVVKKSKPVAYGTELVIPPEIISPGRRGAPVKYRLFGVVYHHGYSAGGGHYTVAVSRPDVPASSASQWIHFDDETVSAVPTDQVVVSEQEAEEAREGKAREGNLSIAGRERCAYLLFYQRVRA